MADIYYDDHMVGIFGMIANYCYGKGFDKSWVNAFWEGLQKEPALYKEFIHFFDNGEVTGNYTFRGYSVLDTFIWQMQHYNLMHDQGRNGISCDKEEMVLRAFDMMLHLIQEPDKWIPIFERDMRVDRLNNE